MKRITGVVLAATLLVSTVCSGSEPELIAFWNSSDETNATEIDHAAWGALLSSYLSAHSSGVNRFDYASLKANPDDVAKLNAYIQQLQSIDPRTYSLAEQKPYWINFYNALTVKIVTDAYPVKSIKNIHKNWIPLSGPWGDVHAKVVGKDLSLDDIEHGILRPIWKDPRIHYGVNCASIGCPNLAREAYTAVNTESLLEAGAREYINHSRGVDLVDENSIVLSGIYDWFVFDFGNSEEGVLAHIGQYADEDLASKLKDFDGAFDYEYDWDLNQP